MSRQLTITSPSGATLKTKNKYMDDDVVIKLSEAENILASNIKKDVSILGISGTYEGFIPSGSVTISENGIYNISAFAEAVVSVPGLVPSGTLEISSNGVYDVGSYASANVNVSGDFPYADFDMLIGGTNTEYSGYCPSFIQSNFMSMNSHITAFKPFFSSNWSEITFGNYALYGCSKIVDFPLLSSTTYKRVYFLGGLSSYSGPLINIGPFSSGNGSVYYYVVNFDNATYFSTYYSALNTLTINIASTGCSEIFFECTGLAYNKAWVYPFISTNRNLTALSIIGASRLIMSGMYCIAKNSALSQLSLSNVGWSYTSWTFYGNYNLEKIHLDMAYGTFGASFRCFQECYKLSSIEIYSNNAPVTYQIIVYSYAFAQCSALSSFPFNLSIYYNAAGAFMSAGIKSIYSSDTNFQNQTTFTSYCFQNCLSLKYVSYPRVVTLSGSCFQGCINLSYVNFWGSKCSLNRIFSNAFYSCSALGSIMFGMDDSLYGGNCYIYPSAFQYCTSLSKVYIPHYSQASNIHALQNVNAFANTPLSDSTYLGYYGSIYVPESLYSSYITATNWAAYSERFVSVTEAEMEQIITDYNNVSYVEE